MDSKVDVLGEVVDVKIIKRTLRDTAKDLTWSFRWARLAKSIIRNLNQPSSIVATKDFRDFINANDVLLQQDSGGLLARSISLIEAKEELIQIHDFFHVERITSTFLGACRVKDFICLGWLEILLKCRWLVCSAISRCRWIFICSKGWNWRQPYLDYLLHRLLPYKHSDAIKIKRKPFRFFVKEGFLCKEASIKHLSDVKWVMRRRLDFLKKFTQQFMTSNKGALGSLNSWFIWVTTSPQWRQMLLHLLKGMSAQQ